MTRIQQAVFEVETDYLGHPYFVTGHAVFNAIAQRVDERVKRALHVSHGVFVPGEYGSFPDWHSQSGGRHIGSSLPEVETYDELFLFRDAAQWWLLDSRPRDAHNAHDLQQHGDRVSFAPTCWFGRPSEVRNTRRSLSWYVHCYLHVDGHGDGDGKFILLPEAVLDGLQVGGARNYGLGELSLADTQVVDLDALDYTRLAAGDSGEFVIELVTPYVLYSEYPGADDQSIPWWWEPAAGYATAGASRDSGDSVLRRREARLVRGDDVYALDTVDHGQVVGYAGDEPVETAKNGVLRVGTHAKYGFGELRVRPAGDDRVPERVSDDDEIQTGPHRGATRQQRREGGT